MCWVVVAEAAKEEKKAEVQDWHGGGGYPGHGGGGSGGYPGHGGGGGGGYPHCRWGCCNRGYHGGCRCCSHPDQIPEPMYRPELVEVHN